MMPDWVDVGQFVLAVLTLAFPLALVWLGLRWLNAQETRRRESQRDLLDRLSGPELQALLETPDGRSFVEHVLLGAGSPDVRRRERFRRGMILFCVGAGAFSAGIYGQARGVDFRLVGMPADIFLVMAGAVIAAAGIGVLIGGVVRGEGGDAG